MKIPGWIPKSVQIPPSVKWDVILLPALFLFNFLALLLYMWVAAVWYGSFRVTGPQASMTVASAASALWKP
jgi:hypothetical protein